jgi:hypothetical protein
MLTGAVQGRARVRFDHPVARMQLPVRAEPKQLAAIGECHPLVALRLDGTHHLQIRQVAGLVVAAFALGVLEVERVAAALTLEQLHRGSAFSWEGR